MGRVFEAIGYMLKVSDFLSRNVIHRASILNQRETARSGARSITHCANNEFRMLKHSRRSSRLLPLALVCSRLARVSVNEGLLFETVRVQNDCPRFPLRSLYLSLPPPWYPSTYFTFDSVPRPSFRRRRFSRSGRRFVAIIRPRWLHSRRLRRCSSSISTRF